MRLLHNGECEEAKAVVHGAIGALAAVCAAYSVAAFVLRPKRHLAINAALYTALVALEVQHVKIHMQCRK